MHNVYTNSSSTPASILHAKPGKQLDFLWLELTNRCNLQCVHCYTESSPHTGDRDILTKDDYISVMHQAYDLGCRKLQFIGGEPQLNGDFHELLVTAKTIGFTFIEVFSNLTRLADKTLRFAVDNDVCFATSVYSDEAEQHDAITKVKSSHQRTIGNLKKLIGEGVTTRAAIIVVDQMKPDVMRTKSFLESLGVRNVGHAATQAFGRGEQVLDKPAEMSGLCGHCWNGKLCIAPDGDAYPCVMARQWKVGNVLEQPLADIMASEPLEERRQDIFNNVWLPKLAVVKKPAKKKPAKKGGYKRKKQPDENVDLPQNCKQSCGPDLSTCGPASCPQSCVPFQVVCEPTGETQR